jgi:hypothetical protein
MTLASVPPEELIQRRLTAIERGAVMLLGKRFFTPVR